MVPRISITSDMAIRVKGKTSLSMATAALTWKNNIYKMNITLKNIYHKK